MFQISLSIIEMILHDYGIQSKVHSFSELQRDDNKEHNPKLKEVRLIIKVELNNGSAVVIRFKNELGVSLALVEKQSQFAVLLKENGVETPTLYRNKDGFAKWYCINDYDVLVMVEEFVTGELCYITTEIAEKTGELLAKMHTIAERNHFHVENKVLFNPFAENELFTVSDFFAYKEELCIIDQDLYQGIVEKYKEYNDILSELQKEPSYAVQGDISNCNLYQTEKGVLGIFDFNRCGDNNLYCDAIMQAVFEARLMDYPKNYGKEREQKILTAFLKGYKKKRPFSNLHQKMYPYLYAIIDAFWSADIKWKEHSLLQELERGNQKVVCMWLKEIYQRISNCQTILTIS